MSRSSLERDMIMFTNTYVQRELAPLIIDKPIYLSSLNQQTLIVIVPTFGYGIPSLCSVTSEARQSRFKKHYVFN